MSRPLRAIWIVLLALATGAVLLAVARGDGPGRVEAGGDARPGATTGAADGDSSGAPATTTTTRGPRGSGEPVTFAFGGDVHFEGMLRDRLAADPSAVLAAIRPVLERADVAMVNLETAVTERGTPSAKQYNFRAPGAAYDALRAGGVDVATMANNHGLDFGVEGLEDSLNEAAARQFPVVGIGRDAAQAYAPHRIEVRGQRIAIFGATQVLDSNLQAAWTAGDGKPGLASAKDDALPRLLDAVRAARADSDTVVVYLHWGTEKQTCPQERQLALAPQLVEAGADVVVGAHAHRLQGGGRRGPALVHYGLGNFAFYTTSGPGTDSGVLLVTVTGREVDGYEWVPARLRNGSPVPLEGGEADAARAAWDGLRSCTDLTP